MRRGPDARPVAIRLQYLAATGRLREFFGSDNKIIQGYGTAAVTADGTCSKSHNRMMWRMPSAVAAQELNRDGIAKTIHGMA